MMGVTTVKVPKPLEAMFEEAEGHVQRYFERLHRDPTKGTIEVGGERYILVRASSMSVQFFDFIKTLYPGLEEAEATHAAATILYDIGRSIGRTDARAFHATLGVTDPIAKLSMGPVHFSHAGWAFVDISPESSPAPDQNYYLLYDHPQSFEADSWRKLEKRASAPMCVMNGGYSTGWCEVSFGLDLVAREILCRAKGDACCRFIMAPPGRIDDRVDAYKAAHPELFRD
jgi:two-component system cell cycle sensor histidine kinase/response regulator CckA